MESVIHCPTIKPRTSPPRVSLTKLSKVDKVYYYVLSIIIYENTVRNAMQGKGYLKVVVLLYKSKYISNIKISSFVISRLPPIRFCLKLKFVFI